MKTMSQIRLLLILVLLELPLLTWQYELLSFWSGKNIEEYKKYGRVCESCHFPFEFDGNTYYGCALDMDFIDGFCMDIRNEKVRCPPWECPSGKAVIHNFMPMGGPNDDTIILRCEGVGSPNPRVVWKKDSRVIKEVEPPEDPYPVKISDSIIISYEEEDFGTYSCQLENGQHYNPWRPYETESKREYSFTGIRLPSTPDNVTVESFRRHATLKWGSCEEDTSQAKYFMEMTPGLWSEETSVWPHLTETSYTVRHLEAGQTYSFRVQCNNALGYSRYSDPVNVSIPTDAPLDHPTNVTVTRVAQTKVWLRYSWDGDLADDEYVTYEISYSTPDDPGYVFTTRSTNTQMLGLLPDANYTVTVSGKPSSRREKSSAPPIHVKTLPSVPEIKFVDYDDRHHSYFTMTCVVEARPVPEVTWKKGEEVVSTESNVETSTGISSVTSTIKLPRTPNNYGEYECLAENISGNRSRTMKLEYTGKHPPVALENLMLLLTEKIEAITIEMGEMKTYIQKKLDETREEMKQTRQHMEQTREHMDQTREDIGHIKTDVSSLAATCN